MSSYEQGLYLSLSSKLRYYRIFLWVAFLNFKFTVNKSHNHKETSPYFVQTDVSSIFRNVEQLLLYFFST